MAVATKDIISVSRHNWNEFKVTELDLGKEQLKLCLVADEIKRSGIDRYSMDLFMEATNNINEYANTVGLFVRCVEEGLTMNPD